MRPTSYRNLLWITALLASFYVAAPAQTPATQSKSTVAQTSSLNPQLSTLPQSSEPSRASANPPSQEKNVAAGEAADGVERAGIVPDSAGLLPVAAVVGFSFLLGGIICGTIKQRP